MRTPCPSGKPASARPRWNSARRYAVSARDRPLRKPRSGAVACARATLASNAAAQAPKTNSRRLTRSPHRTSEEGWWVVRPRDFAVLRSVAESNFVGCCARTASGGASVAPPKSAQKSRRVMCSLAVDQYGRRLRPSVPRSHALQRSETRRPLTFKGKARPPEESGLLVHGRLPKHLPSQPKDHAPTGTASFGSTIRSET